MNMENGCFRLNLFMLVRDLVKDLQMFMENEYKEHPERRVKLSESIKKMWMRRKELSCQNRSVVASNLLNEADQLDE